jgi:hypothetical protein
LLSELPANRELVRDGDNGLILSDRNGGVERSLLEGMLERADESARNNRSWVREHGLFGPAVQEFLARLSDLPPLSSR